MNKEEKKSNKCPICGRLTHKESKNCIFHASAEEKNEEEFKQALKQYIKKIEEEDNDYDFKGFIFIGNINFKEDMNTPHFKDADFGDTIFNGNTVFGDAIFNGGAKFVNANFKDYVDFGYTNFKGSAIFGGAHFKDADFGDTIFNGNTIFWYANLEGDVNFRGAIFNGDAIFGGVNFKDADFSNTKFNGDANFKGAKFKGHADFVGVKFREHANFKGTKFKDADFGGAKFNRDTIFWGANFKGNTYFSNTKFNGDANFRSVIFNGGANFWDATFKGNANFWNGKFNGDAIFGGVNFKDADFRRTNFKANANFRGTNFKGNADFDIKTIKRNMYFNNAVFTYSKTLSLHIKNKTVINFQKIYLENVFLELALGKKVLINFTKAILRNTTIEKEQIEKHILQEEKKDFRQAKKIYLLIKNNFHSIGKYDDESWAFKKEKDMERLSHSFLYYKKVLKKESKIEKFPILKWIKKGNFKKWAILAFSNKIYGYGEKPWNVVKTALAIIIIFALSFSLIGIGNPEIIELKGTVIYQNSGNIVDLESKGFLKNNEIRNFPDCLYFSLITFTTLGYGDFRPLEGLGRILAGSEAFLGAIMMALFVYTFARRTGGR